MTDTLPFQVQTKEARLDHYLAVTHPDLSRSRWKQLIEAGHVTLNGTPVTKPRTSLSSGDELICTLPDPTPVGLVAVEIPIEILYEDRDLIVVNKEAGLVTHPAPGHEADTLVNALLFHCSDLQGIGGELRPGIVHRLDKDTSGVLVVAKNEQAVAALVAQFSAHTTEKEYRALVWGHPRPPQGTIREPVGRHPVHRKKMAVTSKGREAITRYETLSKGPLSAELRVRIETGRTHQIRVHLSHMGHPIAGDTVYGRARHGLPEGLELHRQMLHAHTLKLTHPRDQRPMEFTAPLPPDFLAARALLVDVK